MVEQQDPARFKMLLHKAEREVRDRFAIYENLAKLTMTKAGVRLRRPRPPRRPRGRPKA